jgi:hypothetical protein
MIGIVQFWTKLKINGGTIQQNAPTAVKNCKNKGFVTYTTVTLAAFLRFVKT